LVRTEIHDSYRNPCVNNGSEENETSSAPDPTVPSDFKTAKLRSFMMRLPIQDSFGTPK